VERGAVITSSSAALLPMPVFAPDGRLLALAVSPQRIRLVDAASGRTIAHLSTLQPLQAAPLAFSPDSTRLIASTNQKTALMWDLRRIRRQLREIDLDWDQPSYPPEHASPPARAPVRSIRVVGAVLEPDARRQVELAALDQRLHDHPDDSDALIQRGWVRLRLGRASQALTDLERGVRLRPDETDALVLLAEAYSQIDALPAARTVLERYLGRVPDDVDAHLFGGQTALRLNLPQPADEDFTRVLEADPTRDNVRFQRALVRLRLGRFQDALVDLDELIRLFPLDSSLYEMRGQAHESLGHHAQARADLKRASESSQGDAQQLNNVAWQLATGPPALRDPERALELARKAVALSQDAALHLNTLGVAQYRSSHYREAVGTLESSLAASKGKTDGFDLFFLAMARCKLGEAARARADFEGAVRWRRDHRDLGVPGWAEELDAFQAEAQALLDAPLRELPDDVFAPDTPGTPNRDGSTTEP
jgi:tetratricopeptide (TPR) repeat protein